MSLKSFCTGDYLYQGVSIHALEKMGATVITEILGATFVILSGSGSFRIAQVQTNDTSLTPANDTS